MTRVRALLALTLCALMLASCSVAKRVAYYSNASLLLEQTNPVKVKKYRKDGSSYEVTESIPVGSWVVPIPVVYSD